MRRRLVSVLAAAAVTCAAAGTAVTSQAASAAVTPAAAPVAAAETNEWKNVRIDGGGFVPGIVFNQKEKNLIYARTDIGGAYRWDQSAKSWIPLLDWVGWDTWGYNGVVSLATDPVDPDRVYVAAGMYTNDWDPNNGAILRSADRGRTWQATALPFKLGGNMPGRGMGERLAVDPNNNNVIYLGAPDGNGLWRSTDKGVTWAKVTSFTNPGDYAADPNDPNGYMSHRPGVVWVTFDPTSATAGKTTQKIYVGVADKENTVYSSADGGATWSRVPGQPTGYIAHKGVLDHESGTLYIATSDTGGPYDGAKGDVWKLNTATGAWTRISPIPSSSADDYFGYSGLTIDRQDPDTIMVATQVSWWPDAIFFRSTDAGATWTRIWDWSSYPNRTKRYTMDVSSAPWLTFGSNPQPPEETPKLGWMNESVEIDPFDSNRMMYGTGATIYGTEELKKWDTGETFTIKPMVKGLEETAVLDLISPPSGAPLVSALGDIGGFRHTDLDKVPPMMFTAPNFTSTTSLDYAETAPGVMVRAGNFTDADRPNDSHVAFSTDGGANWFQGTEPSGINEGGTVAAAADGSRFVWAPKGVAVHHSVGYGNGWTASTGIPTGAVVESDRVNAKRFYGFSGGKFYVSTDGGATFAATAATGLPAEGNVKFKAVPGREGHIWLAGGDAAEGASGIWRSTDGGASFTKLSGITGAVNIGFGKAAEGRNYQALYAVATIGGVTGVFRSDDTGATWVRVNDDQHQYGNMGEALTGDPRIYGRVYLGTNGRGIVYADTGGGTTPPDDDTAAPSRPGKPAASAITSTGATLTWTASTDNVGVEGYDVYREAGATDVKVGSPSPASFALTGLTADTSYTYYVVARDAAGNTSAASDPVTFKTTTGGPAEGGCTAAYRVANSWPGGFQGEVTVKNTGTSAITGWTVKWTFPDGQKITQLWSGVHTQTGADVTVKNAGWNGNLNAGASTSFGFGGSWTGANGVPATVTCAAS
ncbi:cellulose binding domain-containing protein [Planomonospora sp. ID67723]|uniref:cellulose binding domain-containing protein n=1 Tax=Planomonospora sp. ID67723 TaxID=2738134 RepID=UPI0018C43179|nr:cellulose binding domain-containing protein [Planomonospora sp. ID67723]MBG0829193.1 cellulose binding domain-containing protein [Planomonospora sp. ID67723]